MKPKLNSLLLLTLACSPGGKPSAMPAPDRPAPFTESISGTLVTFDMIPLPGDPPLWIGKTEVTWDEYDVFAFNLDRPRSDTTADATARPSRPYGAPDYGWGHQGYPAISIAAPAAMAYAVWLSRKTGRTYRLATDLEWTRAAEAGIGSLTSGVGLIDSLAWHAGNAGGRSHPAGTKRADRLGLHDMLGNAAEWVLDQEGHALTRGGSWKDPASQLNIRTSARPTGAWQERDPQFPKSRWWLSDGPFVGFRVVREP